MRRKSPIFRFNIGARGLAALRAIAMFIGAIAIAAAAATPSWAETLRVVTTTTDLASLTTAVGGDKVEVSALVPPGFNADLYSPRPSDLFKIHQARLFIQVGLGLEDWARDLVNQANNSNLVKGADLLPDSTARRSTGPRRLQLRRHPSLRQSALPARSRMRPNHGAQHFQRARLYRSGRQGLFRR
jgi:ABC-type Zn uptake system ZnuABC Zn-binding protein ZnuA